MGGGAARLGVQMQIAEQTNGAVPGADQDLRAPSAPAGGNDAAFNLVMNRQMKGIRAALGRVPLLSAALHLIAAFLITATLTCPAKAQIDVFGDLQAFLR